MPKQQPKDRSLFSLRNRIAHLKKILPDLEKDPHKRTMFINYRSELNQCELLENIKRDEISQTPKREKDRQIREVKRQFDALMKGKFSIDAYNKFNKDFLTYIQNK